MQHYPSALTFLPPSKPRLSPSPILPHGSPLNSAPWRLLVNKRGFINDPALLSTMRGLKIMWGPIKKHSPRPRHNIIPLLLATSKIKHCFPPLITYSSPYLPFTFQMSPSSFPSSWTSSRPKWTLSTSTFCLLILNNNKTELMVVAPKLLPQKAGDFLLNLGVILDSTLSFQVIHQLHHQIYVPPSKKHLQTLAITLKLCGTDPYSCLHRLPSGPLQWIPVRGTLDSMCRTQLRVFTCTKSWQHIPILESAVFRQGSALHAPFQFAESSEWQPSSFGMLSQQRSTMLQLWTLLNKYWKLSCSPRTMAST